MNSSINPNYNSNIPGWYQFDLNNMCVGFTVNINDNAFVWLFNNKLEKQSFWIKRGTGYSIFDTNASYIGYAESDGNTGYNMFDLSGLWIGYFK